MPSFEQTIPSSDSLNASVRIVGQDFDQEGRRTTLGELIALGGYFPLAKVVDRLPFPSSTLHKWAKDSPFAPAFIDVWTREGGRKRILVDIKRMSEIFDALVQQGQEADARMAASCPDRDELGMVI